MSWFSHLIGGSKGQNPGEAANKVLDQVPGTIKPYYEPYINQGQQAGNKLNDYYSQMLDDPGALYSKFGQGYKESPGYQFKLQQALNAGQNASAAGGMAGTPQNQYQQMGIAEGFANQDYEEYMKHIMDLFGGGISGNQKFQEQGYGASMGLGDSLANNLGSQAQYKYAGEDFKNKQHQQRMKNFMSLISGVGSAMSGGMGGFGDSFLPSSDFGVGGG